MFRSQENGAICWPFAKPASGLGEYASFAGTRVPTFGEAWWELPDGRFVYWRGRVTSLELLTWDR
jgi:hypothetical protein